MSYLAWPVAVNGQITNERGKPLHMTLKYFGQDPHLTTGAIFEALLGMDVSPIGEHDNPKWELNIMESAGFSFYVIELLSGYAGFRRAFAALEKLSRHNEFKVYRPHITLDKHHWEYLKACKRGIVRIEMGPLALMGLT